MLNLKFRIRFTTGPRRRAAEDRFAKFNDQGERQRFIEKLRATNATYPGRDAETGHQWVFITELK